MRILKQFRVTQSSKEKGTMSIFHTVEIDLDELVDTLASELDQDKMFQLICDLDECMQDWDFTKRLFLHFKNEMIILLEEEGIE